jgi:16S rRNA processing protein RimM
VSGVDPDTWVPLAEIARPHGVRGEVRLRLFNKSSDTLLDQDEVLVRLPDGEEHEVSVDAARRADDAILMKLHSVDDRDRAEEIRGSLVCVRRRDFPKADEGEFYAVDVIGCAAHLEGKRIGEVTELISYPSVQALRVRADDGEGDWEVPLTRAFVEDVDTAARVVTIASLDGVERETPKRKEKKVRKPRTPRWLRDKQAAAAAGEGAASGDGAASGEATGEAETPDDERG